MLASALDTHPEVRCYGELFQRGYRWSYSYDDFVAERPAGRLRRMALPWESSGAYLERISDLAAPAKAVGFKIMYNQLRRHPELLWLFARRRFGVIHLVRRNVLRTEVSAALAKRTGVWATESELPPDRVALDVEGIVSRLDHRQAAITRHRHRLARFAPLEVVYEELTAKPESQHSRVLRFLGVDDTLPLEVRKVKLTPDSLERVVENYARVADALRGTPYEHLVTED